MLTNKKLSLTRSNKPGRAYFIGLIYECPTCRQSGKRPKSQLLGRKHIDDTLIWTDKEGESGFELQFKCPLCQQHHYIAFENDDWAD